MCRRINSYRLVTSEFPICRTVRFCRVRAESFNLVGFIGLKISLEPVPVCRIFLGAFVGENVRGDPVEEPPIVGDDHGASWKLKKCVFEAGEGFDVEVVGRFVEKQHVAALLKRERKVKAIAFTAGEHTRWLLLIWTLKPKRGHVRSAWYLGFTDLDVVKTVGDHFPECFLWVDATTSLVDIGQLDGLPDFKFAAIEFFKSDNCFDQRCLTHTVRTDNPDNSVPRQRKTQPLNECAITKSFRYLLCFEHDVSQAGARRDLDLFEVELLCAICFGRHFLVSGEAGLLFCLTSPFF